MITIKLNMQQYSNIYRQDEEDVYSDWQLQEDVWATIAAGTL